MCITNLAATWTAAIQKRVESLQRFVVTFDRSEETPNFIVFVCFGVTEQNEDRLICTKSGSQRLLDTFERCPQVRGCKHSQRQVVNFGRQRVVCFRDLDQVLQFSLEIQVFLSQDRYLAFYQRNGTAGDVWQSERAEKRAMSFEEIRVFLQKVLNCIL